MGWTSLRPVGSADRDWSDSRGTDAAQMAAGTITLDLVRREADVGRGPVRLAQREFVLLHALIASAGVTLSTARLLAAVWNGEVDDANVLRVYVRRLRAKLGDDTIKTVVGKGYRIEG